MDILRAEDTSVQEPEEVNAGRASEADDLDRDRQAAYSDPRTNSSDAGSEKDYDILNKPVTDRRSLAITLSTSPNVLSRLA